jgi:hypothetical protein
MKNLEMKNVFQGMEDEFDEINNIIGNFAVPRTIFHDLNPLEVPADKEDKKTAD